MVPFARQRVGRFQVGICRFVAIVLVSVGATIADPTTRAAYTGRPYKDSPAAIPGVIKATEYDIAPDAAKGIAFNYNGKPQANPIRTTPDAIGLARFGKGHVTTRGTPEDPDQTYLGWTHGGEWVKYSLHVAEPGTYNIGGHFAAAQKGGTISFAFGDQITTGPVEIPTTAGYQPGVEVYHVWERLENLATVKLDAGDIVMTVKIEKPAGFNIESITLTRQ